MKKFKDTANTMLLILLDLAAFYCSLTAAFHTRRFVNILFYKLISLQFSLEYFFKLWWVPAIYLFFLAYEGLYTKRLTFWDETKEIIKAITIAIIIILAIVSLGKLTENISRLTVLFLWMYSLFLFPLLKLFCKKALYATGIGKENIIILGAGNAGIETARGMDKEAHLGYNVVGFLDDADEKKGKEIRIGEKTYKVFGKLRHYKKFINSLNVSTVIIAIPSLSLERMSDITNTVQQHTKKVLLVPDLKGIALLNAELTHLFMEQLFLLKINNNLKSLLNRIMKRSFDILFALFFLPFLVLIIGIIGILVKIDSPGPAFYSHMRIGQKGRPIRVYKIRTMYLDTQERLSMLFEKRPAAKREWEERFKLKDDPRITRVGKFLRQTSLDELPQIWNILKGNMSLVGPRPVLQEEIDKYYREYAEYYLMVKPGITGLWQVSGRNDTQYDFRVKLDVWYVLNWSLWLDLVILFKTIKVVLYRSGAY